MVSCFCIRADHNCDACRRGWEKPQGAPQYAFYTDSTTERAVPPRMVKRVTEEFDIDGNLIGRRIEEFKQ